MLRKSGIIFVMLIAVAIMVTASASAASANNGKISGNNGWVPTSTGTIANSGSTGWVVTVENPSNIDTNSFSTSANTANTASIMTASASGVNYIAQGQSVWYSKDIPSCGGFYVDLNWGNSANSLEITIYAPDGSVIGPFFDAADSRIDGRIYLYIHKQTGNVPAGTYYSNVYGYSVYGQQSYTLN